MNQKKKMGFYTTFIIQYLQPTITIEKLTWPTQQRSMSNTNYSAKKEISKVWITPLGMDHCREDYVCALCQNHKDATLIRHNINLDMVRKSIVHPLPTIYAS